MGSNLEEYIRTTADSFSIATRKTDPFGLPQEVEAKTTTSPTSPTAPQAAAPTIPLSDIVARIQINTVMAGERKFLVGSRSISQGDRFPVNYEGQAVWIEVTEVSARQIEFKNLKTGEVAARSLNILPPGMTPGSGGITAPGMTPAGQQAPLDLAPSDPATDSPSR